MISRLATGTLGVLLLTSSLDAALVEDHVGVDGTAGSTSVSTSNGQWDTDTGAAGFRDNVADGGDEDHWLAFNGGHLWHNYGGVGTSNGVASANTKGWMGVYRTSGGDTVKIAYTATAQEDIGSQRVSYKHTVESQQVSIPSQARIAFENQTDGGSLSFVSPSFGPAGSGADVAENLASTTAYGAGDGTEVTVTYDLSSLAIDSGDSVKVTFGFDSGLTNGEGTGIGVLFSAIPEPGTFAALLLSIAGLALRRRPRTGPHHS